MRPAQPVAVVGAGIAGLAASLALARCGFAVDLHEQAERLDEIGAGIQLSPNALRVLDRLGLLSALRERAVEAREVTLRDLRTGRRLANVPVLGSDGTPYLSLTRAHLQRVLLDAVTATASIRLHLGSELVAARQDGTHTVLSFSDGEVATGVVIAADGVRSEIASAFGHPAAEPTDDVAWRLTLGAEGREPLSGITAWLGPRCHVVAYPVDRGGRINVVVAVPEKAGNSRRLLVGADPFLHRISEALDQATPWPLAASDRPRRPGDPPGLLLVGDAAHAMPPYAAQGAALAIEDGFVAAECLARAEDAAAAWQRFEAVRRPRWQRVRRRVAFHRMVYHLPFPFALGRNLVLRARSEASLLRDLGWLYDWTPDDA
ncbi:FAD-dependent monooxygenase [Aureimonas leprariae]|uniref:Salicylate hydroxylase n=1 Tax=Plantimonas leprariae TaxID=2615207 RepID=A0A7V7TX66_9HYPH|nr:FAD-dependent monooxygenase [Aureimonas leprariae]KAB0680763.1 salicylate hydroxylase [Aureimonas leprariae]